MHLGVSSLAEKGFKRIGFCVTEAEDERSNHLYECYLTWYQQGIPAENRIPPLHEKEITENSLFEWVKAHRPDVVFSTNAQHYEWLQRGGYDIPGDISFAVLGSAEEGLDGIARVDIGYRKIGATAIDILKAKLANEPLGPTDNPAVTLIRGEWLDGASAELKPKKVLA
jgi:DNA-binding LacI/PurR family transcriptional regulator